jgi:hypothetical protein
MVARARAIAVSTSLVSSICPSSKTTPYCAIRLRTAVLVPATLPDFGFYSMYERQILCINRYSGLDAAR